MHHSADRESGELLIQCTDGVLRVQLNRPQKRNALSMKLLSGLGAAFADAAKDPSLKLAILTGAGERSFAAGGDLNELSSVRSVEDAATMSCTARTALDAIRAFPLPVIARLNGDALGGGAELAMACDFRVAARSARIGFVQGRLAISTAWGGGVDLMRIAGPVRALRLLARSEVLSAERAQAEALIDTVADEGEALDDALARFAAPILELPPQVLRAFKALTIAARNGTSRIGQEQLETEAFARSWVHIDHWNAADAVLGGRRHR